MKKPLVIDLFCGLGGWTDGFLAEGWDAIGFDIERHDYGSGGYPGQLVLQDVCTIHGGQLIDADCLVASSPCQEFSYRAMPWKRAKALGPPVLGINLFWQAFRIQHEIFEACGRMVPLIAENVRGAQPWVGRAVYNYGSFYLWGDIPPLMPKPKGREPKVGGLDWSAYGDPRYKSKGFNVTAAQNFREGCKVAVNFHEYAKTGKPGRSFQSAAVEGLKTVQDNEGGYGGSFGWDNTPLRRGNSKSNSRKAASAAIAKIPEPLARHIAKIYLPR